MGVGTTVGLMTSLAAKATAVSTSTVTTAITAVRRVNFFIGSSFVWCSACCTLREKPSGTGP